jgi:hypothetical protein
VSRGFARGGERLAPLYESMIDEVIIWSCFRSTSTGRDYAIHHFSEFEDGIIFDTALHPGNCAISISEYSVKPTESGVLIPGSAAFNIAPISIRDLTGIKDIGRLEIGMTWQRTNSGKVLSSKLIPRVQIDIE